MKNNIYKMLSNIKNGKLAKKPFIIQEKKNFFVNILNILWQENIIKGYTIYATSNSIKIFLNYNNNKSVIKQIILIKNQNQYFSLKQLWKLNNSIDIYLFSTSYGVLTLQNCKKKRIGGKLICILK